MGVTVRDQVGKRSKRKLLQIYSDLFDQFISRAEREFVNILIFDTFIAYLNYIKLHYFFKKCTFTANYGANLKHNLTTATFEAVVNPGNVYFISIRQVSLPVDFRYFATY